jgi:hypothetical protein
MEGTKRRYVGIDLGKREYTMAIIGRTGKMSIHTGKTSIPGRQALYGSARVSDTEFLHQVWERGLRGAA